MRTHALFVVVPALVLALGGTVQAQGEGTVRATQGEAASLRPTTGGEGAALRPTSGKGAALRQANSGGTSKPAPR